MATLDTDKYAGADFKLTGVWDGMADLDGDEIKETELKEVKFYMAGYMVVGGDDVVFINSDATSDVAGALSYNDVVNSEA